MFERFASASRNAVTLAMDEARLRGDRRIGTDHLLLGALHDPDISGILGVSVTTARATTDALDKRALLAIGVDTGDVAFPTPPGTNKRAPFTSGSRSVMQRMLAHTTAEKARQITPQHLLLALLERQRPDPAAVLLDELAIDRADVERKLKERGPAAA